MHRPPSIEAIDIIEPTLAQLRENNHYYWAGRLYHLAPLFTAFGIHTIGGSILFGYDSDGQSNFDTGNLFLFLERLREWHRQGYLHSEFLNGKASPDSDVNVGMMTVNLWSVGYIQIPPDGESRSYDFPPLSWAKDPDSDVVIIDAASLLSRRSRSLFLDANIQHETAKHTVSGDTLPKVLQIYEYVRVLMDPNVPRYWLKWVYGEPGVHYHQVDGTYVSKRVWQVKQNPEYDDDYGDFLSDRDADEPADFHFKIWPFFRTKVAAIPLFDNAFLHYMDSEIASETLPVFWNDDRCDVKSTAMEVIGVVDELALIARAIAGSDDLREMFRDLEDLVSSALQRC